MAEQVQGEQLPDDKTQATATIPATRLAYLESVEQRMELVAPLLEAMSKDGSYLVLRRHRDALREAGRALADRVAGEVAYGDQWPEVAAMNAALEMPPTG